MPLDEETKVEIQAAYAAWLGAGEARPRKAQKLMIAEIARTLGGLELDKEGHRSSSGGLALIEAGTGVGKTLAYLIPTICMAARLGKKVVVATATTALQEQLTEKDLPDLMDRSGLQCAYGLVKGRGRYLCLSRLEQESKSALAADQMRLFPDSPAPEITGELSSKLQSALFEGRWDGDRDHWPEVIPDSLWRRFTSDEGACSAARCAAYKACPYAEARRGQGGKDLLVTNHSLLLSDLALGGGALLPAPEAAIFVIDEGHRFPEQAIQHFGKELRTGATAQWVEQANGILGSLAREAGSAGRFSAWAEKGEAAGGRFQEGLEELRDLVEESAFEPGKDARRFEHGRLPAELVECARALSNDGSGFHRILEEVMEYVEEQAGQGLSADLSMEAASEYGVWLSMLSNKLLDALDLLADYGAAPEAAAPEDSELEGSVFELSSDLEAGPAEGKDDSAAEVQARWARLIPGARDAASEAADLGLYSSSVVAGSLDETFWSRACAVIVTSATLRALNSFERFRFRAAIPEQATENSYPSPFRYQEVSSLVVPREAGDGRKASEHTDSLVKLMPDLFEKEGGTLVLFSSWRQLREVRERIPPEAADLILGQDDYGKQEVLRLHRERIDAGEASVLFGVASFAEGIDLPGAYCRHVIIAKLPFPPPDDPVDAALSEWIELRGGNAFFELSVPTASLRLIQASGRLLRSEDDYGQVTILDHRLISKPYGRRLVEALPPFRRVFNG